MEGWRARSRVGYPDRLGAARPRVTSDQRSSNSASKPGLVPFGGVGGMVEPGGGVEDRLSRRRRVGPGEFAALDAVGDDRAHLAGQRLDMSVNHLARFGGDRVIGGEKFRLGSRLLPLDGDQAVEPSTQPLRRRRILANDFRERIGHPRQPALDDRVAERRLAGKMAVDAAVADAERAGDIDDGGLGRPEAGQHLFRRVEDPVGGQRRVIHRLFARLFSLSSVAICWAT